MWGSKKNKDKFANLYTKGKELGQGAFATVYKVTRKSDKKDFAAKIITNNVALPGAKNGEMIWDAELKINEMLDHQNVVNMLEMFEKPNLVLIFDLCQGGDLFDDIEKRDCYTEKDAAGVMRQILKAMEYLHGNLIVHRDLKPENLLLTADGTVKVADFGLAVQLEDETKQTFGTAGSPDYIAPEILNKKFYNFKVDVWSTGVILYILLCGYPPFEDQDDIKAGKVVFYADDWKHVSIAARTLIVQMLNIHQMKRLNMKQCLAATWMKEETEYSNAALDGMQKSLKAYNAKRKFQAGVKAVKASLRLNAMKVTK